VTENKKQGTRSYEKKQKRRKTPSSLSAQFERGELFHVGPPRRPPALPTPVPAAAAAAAAGRCQLQSWSMMSRILRRGVRKYRGTRGGGG